MSAFARTWVFAALAASASGCLEPVVLGDGRSLRDAAMTDAAEPDASAPDPSLPRFSEPVLIEPLANEGDGDDDDPSLNRALTWLFFNSTRDGGAGREDIWFSKRASTSDEWSTPQPAEALNSDARETGTALSADGLTIYWSSDREGGAGELDVYMATRASLQDEWSAPQAIDALNSSGDDLISAVTGDELALLFARRTGDDGYQLWWARRADRNASWSAPEPIEAVNGDSDGTDPFLVFGGAQLLFSRDGDLQLASKAPDGERFGEAMPLATLNSDDEDTDPWSTEDLSYVVFASDRSGENRIYEARRANDE